MYKNVHFEFLHSENAQLFDYSGEKDHIRIELNGEMGNSEQKPVAIRAD